MTAMETVRVEERDGVVRVTLDRPDVRNAFNGALIAELTRAFAGIGGDARAAVLTGAGSAFCAGADIEWMRRGAALTAEEGEREAADMAAMYRAVDECPVPVLGRVNGPAMGGGAGLVAACDIVVASEGAVFAFPEVRLGIIPAVISSFVLAKIGERAARRYFLTGEKFGAAEAKAVGLAHEVVPADALDGRIDALLSELRKCGPKAVRAAKKLIRDVAAMDRDAAIGHSGNAIAEVRASDEAREGLGAFMDGRKPGWS